MTINKWSETIHTQRKEKNKKKESKSIAIGLVVFILQRTDGGYHIILVKYSQRSLNLFQNLQIKYKCSYIIYF